MDEKNLLVPIVLDFPLEGAQLQALTWKDENISLDIRKNARDFFRQNQEKVTEYYQLVRNGLLPKETKISDYLTQNGTLTDQELDNISFYVPVHTGWYYTYNLQIPSDISFPLPKIILWDDCPKKLDAQINKQINTSADASTNDQSENLVFYQDVTNLTLRVANWKYSTNIPVNSVSDFLYHLRKQTTETLMYGAVYYLTHEDQFTDWESSTNWFMVRNDNFTTPIPTEKILIDAVLYKSRKWDKHTDCPVYNTISGYGSTVVNYGPSKISGIHTYTENKTIFIGK